MPELVNEPVPGVAAFSQSSRGAQLSQAAQLLAIGAQIRGDLDAFRGKTQPFAPTLSDDYFPREDIETLGVPLVMYDGKRFSRRELRGRGQAQMYSPDDVPRTTLRIREMAEQFHGSPSPEITAHLLEVSLLSPYDIVRVAAASSYFDLTSDPEGLIEVLVAGTRSPDPLAAKVSATSLAHIEPRHPRLMEMTGPDLPGLSGAPLHTSLLVHGTWAKNEPWWQPRGDFHSYVLHDVWKDLYGAPDRFGWSGGYTDASRSLAGSDLGNWLATHSAHDASLMAHSHGGSVSMLASHVSGITMNKLVLLSCPVHMPKYMPNFSAIGKVVSIRVKMDLVILADRGGQRFKHPQIDEHVLPIWFDHSATHDVSVWKKYNVTAML